MQDFEKLGMFYLGREYDLASRNAGEQLLLYDAKDLVTHAVCVGMTGSGKTGLCVALLEEAAIDGVPAIVIDPKGDLGNLLLTFPDLNAPEFLPWVNHEDARRKGLTPEAFAAQQAAMWKEGLARWGQDGQRIRRLKEAAEFTIYTPGSNAGVPVAVLKSFPRPGEVVLAEPELLQERVQTTVSGLLGLVGVEADPVQSREHILLSVILTTAWRAGKDLDLAGLIQGVQVPPVQRVGVIDLESFYPKKERFALAMALNNLLASPGFELWMQGEALDVQSLLYTAEGKPRVAVFSIAHLSDAQRMFFVSLLLAQVLAWTRAQTGTTSLRALLYMDEIFGYFPPTANPPSKGPLLTLLKQARAFGVGVVLATQNPVDLDYKGLSNAGTWFIGRLQTERDKLRVLDGLEGAAAGGGEFDRGRMEQVLAGLGNRVFLMHNVHEDGPVVFETRWAMSYLRGPLTRPQIRQLMAGRQIAKPPAIEAHATAEARPVMPGWGGGAGGGSGVGGGEVFVPVRSVKPAGGAEGAEGGGLVYRPRVYADVSIFYADANTGADLRREARYLLPLPAGQEVMDWAVAEEIDVTPGDLESVPVEGAAFGALPAEAPPENGQEQWKKGLTEHLYRTAKVEILRSPTFGKASMPGESERDFRVRLQQDTREARDAAAEKLRARYGPKLAALQERLRRAEAAVAVQQEQAKSSRMNAYISAGSTLLGAFLGRKVVSAGNLGKAATTARGVGRTMKESQDVARAQENAAAVQEQLAQLERTFEQEMGELATRFDAAAEPFERIAMRPRKTDIQVRRAVLAWVPYWRGPDGEVPAWT